MTDFQTGLLLLAVGFPTVFVILYVVVLLGKGLILFVNKYIPEASDKPDTSLIAPNKLAAIAAAINKLTEGKGKVTKIEKL
jgi:oxaloacetate decarboxylase gamma subunit